jgi:hypothetical protein
MYYSFLKTAYLPGNKVICISPFYTTTERLVKNNTIGYVVDSSPNNDTVNIVWHTDEFPYTQQTQHCDPSLIALA